MISKHLKLCLIFLACALESGCSSLPNSGPTVGQVEDNADAADHNQIGYKIVPVTPAVLDAMTAEPSTSMQAVWGSQQPASVSRIGRGDILSVTLFVAGGGNFGSSSGDQSGGEGGTIQSQNLPPLQVDDGGNIFVPYAGSLHVLGKTPLRVQTEINQALAHTVFRPQAVVLVSRNIHNTVLVSGDVRHPGRYPIEVVGQRLRDVITTAGGAAYPDEDMTVRVTRDGNAVQVPMTQIDTVASENIPLHPLDDVQLLYRPRTFLSFGASGKVSQIKFDSDKLSLAEGIARIGGPADDRANPQAVYLFRFETPKVVAGLGLPAVVKPIIYKVNMLDPQSYFEMQRIAMRDKDLIYVANASSNGLFRFLNLVNSVFVPIGTTYSITHG